MPNFSFGAGLLGCTEHILWEATGAVFISFLVCVRCFIHLSIKFSRVCDSVLALALSTAIYFFSEHVSPVLYVNVSTIIWTEIKKCWKMKALTLQKFTTPQNNKLPGDIGPMTVVVLTFRSGSFSFLHIPEDRREYSLLIRRRHK